MTENEASLNPRQPAECLPGLSGRELRTVRSEDLLQGQVELLIAHGEETYRLRLTRSGKLILQK